MKKIIIVLFIFAASAIFYWGKDRVYRPKDAQIPYHLVKIERRDIVRTVSATGSLSAVVTVEVGSEVSGQIKKLLVDFNSPVAAGQIIARINPEGYQTLVRQAEAELEMAKAKLLTQKTEILRYQANLENAEANLSAAQAQIKKIRATLENAERDLKRKHALVKQDFVSKNEYDTALTTYEEAKAQFEQAQAQESAAKSQVSSGKAGLAVARAQVREAEAQVQLKIAALDKRQVDLENTIIRSPVNGVVIDRSVDVGQTVAASLQAPTLFTIAQDLSKMQVSTSVDEADIGRIREGQPAGFTVDAFGTRKFEGRVKQIRKMGKTVQNVVTYDVIISADNTDLSLMPGMTADVEIELLKKRQVLAVADAALRFTPPDIKPEESGSAQASAGEHSGYGGRRADPNERIKRYTEALNLTASQQERLTAVFDQNLRKIKAAREASDFNPMHMSELRNKVRKETQAAILRILTSEQRVRFEAMGTQTRRQKGTLWRLSDAGRPMPIPVTLGVDDGSYTEISGPGIAQGMEVIAGVQSR